MKIKKTDITKGSPEWNILFKGLDTDDYLKRTVATDVLHALGDVSALLDRKRPKVLIVGTRDLRHYEAAYVYNVIKALSQNPSKPVVISGLALGVDTTVHQAALSHGLATIAVLPTGLDKIYPYNNKSLAERIATTPGCALLTQFKEKTNPIALNFVVRTILMTLLSDIAVIPFSKKKGSSMIAARMMNELDRGDSTYALPGRIDDVNSEGCNQLIRTGLAQLLDLETLKII